MKPNQQIPTYASAPSTATGSRVFQIDEAFSTLMDRKLTNVYKVSSAPNGVSSLLKGLLILGRMHQLKSDCQLMQQPQIKKLECISKPSPRWPTLHIARTSLTQPTPLKLNWATGSVITDGCRLRLWFLMTQKFINFKTQIFSLHASRRCSCNTNCAYVCSLKSGTCTLEPTSICILWKLRHRQLN